jgi:aminoglycoside phosphotransferase family enzyme/predicted kinase
MGLAPERSGQDAGPGPGAGVPAAPAVAETHSALVVFVGDRAYKMKKPVDLGFLDFTTRSAREAACHRELELNRRLAPDVYLGVVDVVDEDGVPCDHLVVMRRMPKERRLSRLLADEAGAGPCVQAVARQVATFHASVPAVDRPEDYGGAAAVRANWDDNVAAIGDFPEVIDPDERDAVGALAHAYLDGRGPLFRARLDRGQVRDGHGDLLADDIFCLDDGPRILDCLDFSERYRYADILLDAAFLAMDIERLGRPELARAFLRAWTEFTDDRYPDSLAHHYVAYRAHVRAKVACLRAGQGLDEAAATARQLHGLAHRHLEAGAIRLVLVGGLPGTGKTTLARGLGDATGWSVLHSDETRKELAGMGHHADARAEPARGLYTDEQVSATYEELARRATVLLARGESVILDATWTIDDHRDVARRTARATSSTLVELRCEAPLDVATARVERRGPDASDAHRDVVRHLRSRTDPWPGAVAIDTTRGPHEVVATALRHVGPTGGPA